MPVCEPVICVSDDDDSVKSYGRRRRRRSSSTAVGAPANDLLLVESIHISDTFQFERQTSGGATFGNNTNSVATASGANLLACGNLAGAAVAGAVFLALQVMLLVGWAVVRSRRPSPKAACSTDSLGKLYDSGYARRF